MLSPCRKIVRAAVVLSPLLFCWCATVRAATDPTIVALKSTLQSKQLFLRSFRASPEQKFVWKDDHLTELNAEPFHAFAVFVPTDVSGDRNRIVIRGTQYILARNVAKNAMVMIPPGLDITLRISLEQSLDSTAASRLQSALFFSDNAAALAGVPKEWMPFVPADNVVPETTRLLEAVETPAGWQVGNSSQLDFSRAEFAVTDPHPEKPTGTLVTHSVGLYAEMIDASGNVVDLWMLVPIVTIPTGQRDPVESAPEAARMLAAHFLPARWQGQAARSIRPIRAEFKEFVHGVPKQTQEKVNWPHR